MKLTTILLILLLFFVNNVFSSPLIFKVTKEINTQDLIELGSFDATKYKQIRIGVNFTSIKSDSIENNSSYAQLVIKRVELIAKLESFRRIYNEQNPTVIATSNEIVKVNNDIENLAELLKALSQKIEIVGIEGKDEIPLYSLNGKNTSFSIVLDTPPSKVSIKVKGKGSYSLYVWASQ